MDRLNLGMNRLDLEMNKMSLENIRARILAGEDQEYGDIYELLDISVDELNTYLDQVYRYLNKVNYITELNIDGILILLFAFTLTGQRSTLVEVFTITISSENLCVGTLSNARTKLSADLLKVCELPGFASSLRVGNATPNKHLGVIPMSLEWLVDTVSTNKRQGHYESDIFKYLNISLSQLLHSTVALRNYLEDDAYPTTYSLDTIAILTYLSVNTTSSELVVDLMNLLEDEELTRKIITAEGEYFEILLAVCNNETV